MNSAKGKADARVFTKGLHLFAWYSYQLRYLDRYLSSEFSILNIEEVKPTHIKSFMSRMDP